MNQSKVANNMSTVNKKQKNQNEKLNIKIVIATHKKYRMPEDDIYIPLHVGAEGRTPLGYQGDNIGDNISIMNPHFCELTGMYWMWKNLKADYLGLVHYRRHFCFRKKGASKGVDGDVSKWTSLLSSKEAQVLCRQYDAIVPFKRKYVIESLESHYAHTHYKEHLEKTREIITKRYPQYLDNYDRVLKQKSGYMFNMFLMRSDLVDEYCAFLFFFFFDLDKNVDTSNYSAFQARYPGRVGEILFNVWLDKKVRDGQDTKAQSLKVKEIKHIHMESINWWNKGMAFLKAKFFGKRYEHGF